MKRTLQKTISFISIIAAIGTTSSVSADQNVTPVGRYLSTINAPLASQADLLAQTFRVRFPNPVKTIGDAMHYLLQFSGYSLVAENSLIPEAKQLMNLPLPQADRSLGPLSLKDGLLTLVGNSFGLLIDPVHRLVSLRLLPQYQLLYQKTSNFIF